MIRETDALDAPRFARTKIQPARPRTRRIDRPALDDALLDAALSKKLVLLHAPAGFGKTTALATLSARLAERRSALAWVSLDAGDDPARLFACLAAALEPYDLPWRTLPDALIGQMAEGGAGARRALAELLDAMAAADLDHGVIVLEDLHRVTSRELLALGDEMVERLPDGWSIVLSSRVLPALALARVRAQGELAEFGQDALAFSADETAAFAAAEGEAGAAAAQALFDRTRGWPAGVRLLLSTHVGGRADRSGGARMDRVLFDYLTSEVLDALPQPLHDFLMRCSVLPELTASRAAAVSGDPRAAAQLDEIERRALFATPLDTSDRTLVLHDLLRDALAARLAKRAPDERPLLLRRAAASEPDPLRRVDYLLQATDWAAAEAALSEAAGDLFVAGGMADVQRVIEQFDAGWRERSPVLARLAGQVAFLRTQWQRTADAFAGAARLAGDRDDERHVAEAYLAVALYALDRNAESEALIAKLHGEALAPRARRLLLIADATQHLRRGEHAAIAGLFGEVIASLESHHTTLFDWWEAMPAANWTAMQGLRAPIERYVAGALERIGTRALPMRGEMMITRAFCQLWAGRIDAARADAAAAEDDLHWLACSGEMRLVVQLFRVIEGAIAGRAADVQSRLEALLALEAEAPLERRRLWGYQVAVYGVRMSHLLDAGPATLREWARRLKENPLDSEASGNHRAVSTRARLAAIEGRWADAAAGFESLEPQLDQLDVMAQHIELRIRGAHALLRCARPERAARLLVPALERVQREGDRGQLLLGGPEVLGELASADWGRLLPAPQVALLGEVAAWARALRGGAVAGDAASSDSSAMTASAAPASAGSRDAAPAAGGLTDREADVLALIATGQSNKHIARALDISPHTVKRHVANILDKLVLGSRGEAAAWWHANVRG